ncbi:hypothetical protein [Cohnella sp. OV330]|uniref:hypothetical protein n=1 Tax=Cohnella sp. OV330 TaxID=1855288 RepID=UPI000B7F63DF|nr:hypothetical protein [Cohnella sp. OV330]
MNNELGKIFTNPNGKTIPYELEHFFNSSNFLISKYNYNKPNSYFDLINKADALGMEQFTLPPNDFFAIIKKLLDYNFKVKSVEFDPPLNEEDQELFNRKFELVSNESINDNNLSVIKEQFDQYNKDLHSIPRKLFFLSYQGNGYTLYNNGIIDIEDEHEINELGGLLTSFVDEVQSRQ